MINVRSGEHEALRDGGVTEIVKKISTQYSKIDIFFQVKWANRLVSVIVEDKTQTELHGEQLERYLTAVRTDTIEEDLMKPVYFKTGYLYGDEREEAEKAGYCVFDIDDIMDFFRDGKWSKTHDFVRDFAEHVANLVDNRKQALEESDLDQDFVQWEFMVALGNELRLGDMKWPARWFNIGGGAWTQYPHYECRGTLFWRLDAWKPLRLMVDTNKVGSEHALALWDDWEGAFAEATKRCGLEPAPFRRVRRRNGIVVAEGTIGAVDAHNFLRREGLSKCVERVSELHRRFVKSAGPRLA